MSILYHCISQKNQPDGGHRILSIGRHPRLCDTGWLNQAVNLSKQIADFLKKWSYRQGGWRGDAVSAAIASYQQAAELFEMEHAKSQASSCLQKVAELRSGAMDPPELLRAAEIHKSLGR